MSARLRGPLGGAWALVPVKPLGEAKSRLAPALAPSERARLQAAMLATMLAALARSRRLAGVAVLTCDPRAAQLAAAAGAVAIAERSPRGLNEAAEAGAAALALAGAEIVVATPADAPLLDPRDIDRAVALCFATGATLVSPDRRLDGTNALVFPAARPPRFAYGPGSFLRHAGAPGAVALHLPSLALDIDTPEDLAALNRARRSPRFQEIRR